METEDKPTLRLTGTDGNAFVIIGAARAAARRAKWTPERIAEMQDEMISGDYDHVIATCFKYFEVE